MPRNSPAALLALLLFAAPFSCTATSQPAQRYPAMVSHGNTYQNSCSPSERRQLRATLSAKKIADRAQLWKIIDVLLCADPNPATNRYIANSMETKVAENHEGTGQDPHVAVMSRSTEAAQSLLASRSVWDAAIVVDLDGVRVHYRSDEVCVTGRKLRHAHGRWRIFEVGQACD